MWKDPWSTGLSQQRVLFTDGELRFSKWEAVLSTECVLCAGGCVAVSKGISSLWRPFLSLPFIWNTRETVGSRLQVQHRPHLAVLKGPGQRALLIYLPSTSLLLPSQMPWFRASLLTKLILFSREEGRQVPGDWGRTLELKSKIDCAFQIPSLPETLIRVERPDVSPDLPWHINIEAILNFDVLVSKMRPL